jgi:ATP-dependent helicase/nuclease subunit B
MIELISPRDNFIEAVAVRLRPAAESGAKDSREAAEAQARPKDYSGQWVVFPEKRPAYYLRKALAERERTSFIPPVLDSMDGFIGRVYQERLGIGGRLIDPLDAVALLFEIHRQEGGFGSTGEGPESSLGSGVLGETEGQDAPAGGSQSGGKTKKRSLSHDHFMSADSFFPLGMKIYHDLEEISLAGARTSDIRELDLSREFEEKISPGARGRLQSLADFYEKFYAVAGKRGYSTPGSRSRAVLDGLRPELFAGIEKIIFAGFYSLTKVERQIIRTMMNWENCSLLLMTGRGLESLLAELGPEGIALIERARQEDESLHGRGQESKDTPGCREAENKDSGKSDLGIKAEKGGELDRKQTRPDKSVVVESEIELYKSPDSHGQIFAFNKAMEEKLRDRALGEKQAVILPAAETLFPLYQQTLTALGDDHFNISMGYPLSRTPIYTFFDQLMELVQSCDEDGRLYGPHYLRFVLHPYAKNIYFPAGTEAGGEEKRADLTRILFHAIEGEMTQGRRRTKSFWKLDEIEDDAAVGEAVEEMLKGVENPPDPASLMEHLRSIHANTVGLFGEIRNVGDFAAKMARVLDYIYENSTARLHHFFHPFAEAFTRQLDGLGKSLLEGMEFEDRDGYFNLFRKVVASGTVPFEGTPLRGLQVLGFWEARCIPFEDVSIMDVNEDVLPSFRREDTLLPFAARRRLGLPTYQENERRMEYYLDTLIRGARKVRLFFVENNDKERSRFVEKLVWERQKREGERNADKYIRTIQYRVALTRDETPPVEKSGGVAEFLRGIKFSATALDMYLRCPLQFYYSRVLGIEEKEEIGEQMEKKDIGSFVHGVLEEYFRKFAGGAVTERDLDIGELDRIIGRKFEESYGGDLAGSAYLLKLQVERHLEEFVVNYQIPVIRNLAKQGKSLVLLGLEQVVQAEISGGKFELSARLDRSEKRGDDIYILDYKTGAGEKSVGINFKKLDPENRESWSDAIGSVQIPFYNLVYSRAHDLPRERVQGLFLMLGKSHLGPKIEYSPYDAEDEGARREQIGMMEHIIVGLIREIIDPGRPFEPTGNSARFCPACPYGTICNRK